MLNVGRNQHRWKNWIEDDHARELLEQGAERLQQAWKSDEKYPGAYPMKTSFTFAEIHKGLKGRAGPRTRTKLPRPAPPPQSLAELVREKLIASVYEEQNAGSYKNALKQAWKGFEEGAKVWRKILRAVDAAYLIDYVDLELAPKPRVHFLHKNLLALLEAGILDEFKIADLRREGIQEGGYPLDSPDPNP